MYIVGYMHFDNKCNIQLDDGVNDKFLKHEIFHFVNIFLFCFSVLKRKGTRFNTLNPQTRFNHYHFHFNTKSRRIFLYLRLFYLVVYSRQKQQTLS